MVRPAALSPPPCAAKSRAPGAAPGDHWSARGPAGDSPQAGSHSQAGRSVRGDAHHPARHRRREPAIMQHLQGGHGASRQGPEAPPHRGAGAAQGGSTLSGDLQVERARLRAFALKAAGQLSAHRCRRCRRAHTPCRGTLCGVRGERRTSPGWSQSTILWRSKIRAYDRDCSW